jgi:NhaA family Na+:H+ antiporter
LLSPADRIERAVAPWSAYVILPLFAFSATGVALNVDFSAPNAVPILLGVILGLVIGKPLGIALASFAAIKARLRSRRTASRFRTSSAPPVSAAWATRCRC